MLKRKRIKTYKYSWMTIKSNSPIDNEQVIKIYRMVDEDIYMGDYYNNVARKIYHILGCSISRVEVRCKRAIFNPNKFKVLIKLTWKDVWIKDV